MTLRVGEKEGTKRGETGRGGGGGGGQESERERLEREKREQGEIRRVVLLSRRLGAGGLEQVITSGCGADAARAGPS